MRKEDLLIRCSAMPLKDGNADKIDQILNSDLDWEYILRNAKREGVICLLFGHLQYRNALHRLPQDVLERLKKAYYTNSARNALLAEETARISSLFNEKGIDAVLLKGIYLSEAFYKNIALRPMADVDILIKKDALEEVNDILNSEGYFAPPQYKDTLENSRVSSRNTLMYVKAGSGCLFHIHWHIINSSCPIDFLVGGIDMKRVWSCLKPVRINGVQSLALSCEHQLIYLAYHGFKHCFDRLILASDILGFLRCCRDKIDWRAVVEEAERFNLFSILYYSVVIASGRIGFDIPEAEKIKPKALSFPEKLLSSAISKGIGLNISVYTAYFLMQDSLANRLQFIKRTFLPSNYVMAHNLNLPVSEIKTSHYCQRIFNNLAHFFF